MLLLVIYLTVTDYAVVSYLLTVTDYAVVSYLLTVTDYAVGSYLPDSDRLCCW